MGNILVSQHAVSQILVSLLWLCPFGRRHSSSLQSNFVVPKVMCSFFGLHGLPYAKVPLTWGPRSNWHTSLKLRMVLFGKGKMNVLVRFTADWCLKWKNCIGWLLSSIAFRFYSVSHFTLADCVPTFLPWKGKSPHFSQYWKPFL